MIHIALRVVRMRPHYYHNILLVRPGDGWADDVWRLGGDEVGAAGCDGDRLRVISDGKLKGAGDDLDGFGLVEVLGGSVSVARYRF